MGESPEERRIRKRRERQDYLRRQEEIDKHIADAIDNDPTGAFGREMDEAFEKEFKDLFGQSAYEYGVGLDREMLKGQGVSESDVTEAQRVIKRAAQQAKGGFFSRGNKKKAMKTLKSSGAVKRVAKAHKKGKGCVVVGLLVLGSSVTAVGTLWAAAEVFVRALS